MSAVSGGGIDVLAVMDDAAQVMGRDGYSAIPNDLAKARVVVADLYAALADLEVCANSADYCYTRNPGNFALALRELRDSADRARATLQKARATGAATTDGEKE